MQNFNMSSFSLFQLDRCYVTCNIISLYFKKCIDRIYSIHMKYIFSLLFQKKVFFHWSKHLSSFFKKKFDHINKPYLKYISMYILSPVRRHVLIEIWNLSDSFNGKFTTKKKYLFYSYILFCKEFLNVRLFN